VKFGEHVKSSGGHSRAKEFDGGFDQALTTSVLTVLRGSLVIVGEVFEVMTQVDHGFSSRFDSADPAISINDAN
jgi:hypothetical protein